MSSATILTRRRLIGSALLAAALPMSDARAAGTGKRISLLTRPAGSTRAQFVRDWLRLADGAKTERLLFSEVFGTPEGEIDALASVWFPSGAAPAMPRVPGSQALDLPVREHVFVPADRAAVRVKRTLLIGRKPGMPHAAFVRHWLDIHGPLSQGVPGLAGCVLNVVDERDAARSGIDGISESWWTGPGTEEGGKVASPQADRWNADGANFIDSARTRLLLCREQLLR